MRAKLRLDKFSDIQNFVSICTKIKAPIYVTDGNNLRVNGKSMIGMMYAMEFSDLWCECEKDIYRDIKEFVI